jgi:formylglycine-generating enzyme required for sulfatase activity
MEWIQGGHFAMCSNHHYPKEKPERIVEVPGFWIDRAPVNKAQFAAETGHRTSAEIAPDPRNYPGALPEILVPASLVLQGLIRPVDAKGPASPWWDYRAGAD